MQSDGSERISITRCEPLVEELRTTPLFEYNFAEAELNLAAHYIRDLHVRKAMNLFGVPAEEVTEEQRREAKVLNYATLYGMDYKNRPSITGRWSSDKSNIA